MNKSKFIGLRLDEKMYNKLADVALHEGESLSEVIRRILAQYQYPAGKTESSGRVETDEL